MQSDWERLCALVESVHTALEMTDIPYLKVRVTVCRAAGSSVPSRSIWELHCCAVQICASNLGLELIRSHNLGWGKTNARLTPLRPNPNFGYEKKERPRDVYTGMVNLVIACTAYPDQYLHQYLPQYRITVSLAGKWGTYCYWVTSGCTVRVTAPWTAESEHQHPPTIDCIISKTSTFLVTIFSCS